MDTHSIQVQAFAVLRVSRVEHINFHRHRHHHHHHMIMSIDRQSHCTHFECGKNEQQKAMRNNNNK